jgi:hypothetical protein
MHLVFQRPDPFLTEISSHWRRVESQFADELPDIQRSAMLLLDDGEADLCARLLTDHASTRLLKALAEAQILASALDVRLRALGRLNMSVSPRRPEQIW